ncbi:MAG: heme-binding protein [Candidatus Nitrotoga sp.]|nr:heme-binding protein [Candidatus Nitrotoga sp.]MDO9448163.1 heme-binding protein [Candidatus Nitrotoga sp.]MDP3496813.1 heme-binding protein [Candidatus Nitrotoga sp.]
MPQIIAGLQNLSAANLNLINYFIVLGGGVPVQVEGETIGAIGIGGAPGGHLDEQCAEAGITKIKDRLK